MKCLLTTFLLIKLSMFCLGQYVPYITLDSLQDKVDLLREFEPVDNDQMNNDYFQLVLEIREYSDYLYYHTLWRKANTDTIKEERIRKYKIISTIPYYLYKNKQINYYSRQLYSLSLQRLIKEYRGNIKRLETIKVYPAYYDAINPFLRRAIIAAGGTWNGPPIHTSPHLLVKPKDDEKK